MKKLLIIAIMTVLVLSACGTTNKSTIDVESQEINTDNENSETNNTTIVDEQEDAWGIVLSTKNVSPTGLTLIITQSGGNPTGELQYGARYQILKANGDKWEEAPCYAEVGWEDIAYIVEKDSTAEIEIEWKGFYGELSTGKYRIIKDFIDFRGTGDYDTTSYYAEFEIN